MIFGLADTHLSFTEKVTPNNIDNLEGRKPMSIFGAEWQQHQRRIYYQWLDCVGEQDTVLLAGDLSWAMNMEEAVYDLDFLGQLPGQKIIIRGNHDYWWSSISKVRAGLPSGIQALQNNSFLVENRAICGTRGWLAPNETFFTEHDSKIWRRELQRLELSLQSAAAEASEKIVMLHYMPANMEHQSNEMITLLADYKVSQCIYGHLHDCSHYCRLPAQKWGIRFSLVSADYLRFRPLPLLEANDRETIVGLSETTEINQ